MLDIKLVREHPEAVRDNLRRRGVPEKVADLDRLLGLDVKWRELLAEAETLRKSRNEITAEIAQARKKGKDPVELMKKATAMPEQIKKIEAQAGEFRQEAEKTLLNIPNMVHESVPFGKDDNDNQEVKRWGRIRSFEFKPLDHIDLGLKNGLIDVERAAYVAGARFYYLRADLVRLNYALIQYGLDFMRKKGFQLYQPPYLLRRDVVAGAVALSDFEDTIYRIENEDLYLLATSEHALLGFHKDDIIEADKLPLRYAAISPCFRKEAGAHGRDTKGIFRTHQFEKVEQFIFSLPEDSWNHHEGLLANLEEFWQTLRIPYRIVNVCTGDLGTVAAKKYDLEAWLPGQGKYREMASCSNCTAYQAVRSKIRYREKTNMPTKPVHTLNSTLVATERAIIAIMENSQRADGAFEIPKVLQPYMGGHDIIPVP
ncbi:serine--tRNA ligase [archaeon 13_1_20CM_2_54_9]|nr:MAG: serine--tRNA ligase [Crenarchaeota archaeon 13_1_40CM_3_53_5]OLE76050.1 MAG: serine--tRNA ligase [archaeon 13_1_20CM_2_54_9]TMI27001.1 MAG: serine--tRNA ligase [Candidatus Bathyarchaeota archaeon]TMI30850.1 MAG: serine--tRNA ligase [Candidatus Bathyarchaeota archaeon]